METVMELEVKNKQAATEKVVAMNQQLDDLLTRIELFKKKPDDDEEKFEERGFLEIYEEVRKATISEQHLTELILVDDGKITGSGYLAAMVLASWSRRADIVLPYFSNVVDLFLEAGLPPECHDKLRELFSAVAMYGRVQTTDFDMREGDYSSLHFLDAWEDKGGEGK
jgi:hypothetical protein